MNASTLARKFVYGKIYEMPANRQFSNYTDPETGVKCIFKGSKKCRQKIAAAKTSQQVQQKIEDTKGSNLPMILGVGGGLLLVLFVGGAMLMKKNTASV